MPVDSRNLVRLMGQESSIRNVCILAHIDHGKTSLSDCLLASNGIISPSMQGQIRYLDSRADEQLRGITMESSAISLYFRVAKPPSKDEKPEISEYLVDLIDSPGHIDFSSEVTTSSRLCDGAIILVDAVEGVCSQTVTSLKQAWDEKLKSILVINKIDRLYAELQMTATEAASHLGKVVEQVNAVIGQLFIGKRMENENVDEDVSDEGIYFVPNENNVVFSSALDGWGFTIGQFAAIYERKLGVNREKLAKLLWGDFYFDPKTKKVTSGSNGKRVKKTMFVQFIMENIWAIYSAVAQQDEEKLGKIGTALGVTVDAGAGLRPLFHQWIPVSRAVLLSVISTLPSVSEAQNLRTDLILENSPRPDLIDTKVHQGMSHADPTAEPVIYVSKVIHVPKNDLPIESAGLVDKISELRLRSERIRREAQSVADAEETGESVPVEDEVVIGCARVYSGTTKVGDTLDLLGPKYSPARPEEHRTEVTVTALYLMMGRNLVSVPVAYPGNIVGVAGLDGKIVKSGTLVRQGASGVPNLARAAHIAAPILRVAIEPTDPTKLPQLEHGLELLNVSDPSVEVETSDSGELVLATSGELHLERCLKDLRDRFARVEIQCSPPVVPFRETISNNPAIGSEEDPSNEISIEFGGLRLGIATHVLNSDVQQYLIGDEEPTENGLGKLFPGASRVVDRRGVNLLVDDTREIGVRFGNNDAQHRKVWDESVVAGFASAMAKGPLAGEPVQGVVCTIKCLSYEGAQPPSALVQRRLISAMRDLVHTSMQRWSPRLMLAMYLCDIQASTEVLGRVYGVVTRRKGRVITEEMKDGTPFFLVRAQLPVVESFGFSEEIRTRTSGQANPQLVFDGFEVLDQDPYWIPTTEEELEHLGETSDRGNVALAYVNTLRRRKGMNVNEKVVESAERQK